MKCSPAKTTSKAQFLILLVLPLLPPVTTAADDLDLLDHEDYFDLSQGRFLSNEVINGNSSLLVGLQTALNGVYDYIGC